MRPIIILSLLVLVMALFLMPYVDGAPVKSKRAVTASTSTHKPNTTPTHSKSSQRSTTPTKAHSSSHTSQTSGGPKSKSTKSTGSSTAKTTTVKRKNTTTKSKTQPGRKKRLSQWNWA